MSGFGSTLLFVNHGANCRIYCDNSGSHVYNDPVAPNVIIYGGSGYNAIANGANNVTINGGPGVDSIINQEYGDSVQIYGWGGDDNIRNNTHNCTIDGGEGSDTIWSSENKEEVFLYNLVNGGRGDDVFYIDNALFSTLAGGAGNDSIFNSSGGHCTIYGGIGNDNVWNGSDGGGNCVLVDVGEGNDYVFNSEYATNDTIICGTGDDSVWNYGKFVSIDGGEGSEHLWSNNQYVTLNGGADDDEIHNHGSHVTVIGGEGDDIIYDNSRQLITDENGVESWIYRENHVFIYNEGDGDDTIYNVSLEELELQIVTSKAVTTIRSDWDAIVKVGEGSITLKDVFWQVNGGQSPVLNLSVNEVKYNTPTPNLEYLRQATKEQLQTDLKNFLKYYQTDPTMQSILNDGKDSPYLSNFLPEQAEKIAGIFKDAYDEAFDLYYEDNIHDISKRLDQLGDVGMWFGFTGESPVPAPVQVILDISNIGVKKEELRIAQEKFDEKYPEAPAEDYYNTGYGWSGSAPFGIEVPASAYADEIARAEYWRNKIERQKHPDYYNYKDEVELKKIDVDSAILARNGTLLGVIGGALLIAAAPKIGIGLATAAAIGCVFGAVVSLGVKIDNAYKKSEYLHSAHSYEQSFSLTFVEQFSGQEYGSFKNWFKSHFENKTNSSSNDIVTTIDIEATLLGGTGNDTLINAEDNVLIGADAGNDEISNIGDYVIINAGAGNDYMSNIGDSVIINGGDGDNDIDNGGSNVVINTNDGNDYIGNVGENVTINAGNGNNYVDNVGNSITINTGIGEDNVENFGHNVTINTGSGNDFIDSYASDTTINGGTGNDTITLNDSENVTLIYMDGDGNDVVYDFSASDILSILGDYSITTNGNDIIVSVGDGSILLKNAVGISLNIDNGTSRNDSRDYFVYANGDGDKTISNFKAGSSDDSDVVYLQGELGEINREGNTVTVNGASGGSLIIETDFSTDEAILYTIDGTNIGAAKLADSTNTLYYDRNVYYFRFNDNAGRLFYWGGDDVTIALDNSTPQEYIGLKSIITKSDTEKASGNLNLIGNDLDNEIYSGAGNDYLTGGSGADTFYWGNGDGYDIITDAESADTINLYNVSLSDISHLNISDNKLDLRLNDGSHLDAYYGTLATFQLADNSRWKYQDGDWKQQA